LSSQSSSTQFVLSTSSVSLSSSSSSTVNESTSSTSDSSSSQSSDSSSFSSPSSSQSSLSSQSESSSSLSSDSSSDSSSSSSLSSQSSDSSSDSSLSSPSSSNSSLSSQSESSSSLSSDSSPSSSLSSQSSDSSSSTSENAFISTWDTTLAGNASTILELVFNNTTTYNFTVEWGDGNSDVITSSTDVARIHTYASSGVYEVRIFGPLMAGIRFNNSDDNGKMTEISQWGEFRFVRDRTFYGCTNLVITATDVPSVDTTSMVRALEDCTSLIDIPNIGSWDITLVTNMSRFLRDTGISTTSYDDLLIGWEAQVPSSGVSFDAGSSQYTAGGAAETARTSLVNTYGWSITDGGPI
jgi:hypothetical protein